MDYRIIRRLVYDGNYQRAIEILCNKVESQERLINDLTNKLEELENDVNHS